MQKGSPEPGVGRWGGQTSHTARPGLGDPESLIMSIRHCLVLERRVWAIEEWLRERTRGAGLQLSLSWPQQLWPRLASPPIKLTDFSSSEGLTYLLSLRWWCLEGLTTCAHFKWFNKVRLCYFTSLESWKINDPLCLSVLSWPSLQRRETANLPFDLALGPVRLFSLFRLPHQLMERRTPVEQ